MGSIYEQLTNLNRESADIKDRIRELETEEDDPSITESRLEVVQSRLRFLSKEKREINLRREKLEDRLTGATVLHKKRDEAVFCQVQVWTGTPVWAGPGKCDGEATAKLLLDMGCAMDLNISRLVAHQIGISYCVTPDLDVGSGGESSGGPPHRQAQVQFLLEGDTEEETVVSFALLYPWLESNQCSNRLLTLRPMMERFLPIYLKCPRKASPVKGLSERRECNIIIGEPGMRKLGIGIDSDGNIFRKK